MITQLSIVHFKAIASATIPLGPITVLVGPNDSGKSTILQALQALSFAADPARLKPELVLGRSLEHAATNGDLFKLIELHASGELSSRAGASDQFTYLLRISPKARSFVDEQIQLASPMLTARVGKATTLYGVGLDEPQWLGSDTELSSYGHSARTRDKAANETLALVAADLSSTLLRLDASAIAAPAQLGESMRTDGFGLVGLVDELLTSGLGDDHVARINRIIRTLSPHVKGIATRLHRVSGGKELHFALTSGMVVPASQVSDGIVIAAALAVLSERPGLSRLLIEEPENGLHPRQLKIVADTIRAISQSGTQVVLTTHSPLLLNHFAAEEVVLVTRTDAGVQAQRLSDARDVQELASEMALGELWYNVGDQNLARPA